MVILFWKGKTQMMKRFSFALLTAVLTSLLGGSSARADNLPWSYNWTPNTLTVSDPAHPGTKLHLTNEPLDADGNPLSKVDVTGDSDIVATQIKVESDAPAGFPDEFKNSPELSLKLKITDTTSGETFFTTFTGNFNTNGADKSTASVANSNVKFTPTGTQLVTHTLADGSAEYTIKFVSYTPPPPMGAANQGSIAYHVSIRSLDITKNPPSQTPEPTSMLLAGIGVSFMSLGAWRKRRQQTV